MKFYVHKLGCPKNDVDAEYMAARLIEAGHEPVADPENAESIIVNTCGFILPAREESINEILRLGQLKKSGRLRRLYAGGCLAQRHGDELLASMPELDAAFGLGQLDSLANALSNQSPARATSLTEPRQLAYLDWKKRFITDPYPYAYLKISDGCNRKCSFCAIPAIRGEYRSRPLESILREAQFLADNGKKELILVSQEATLWGCDLPGRPDLLDLLRELDAVEGVAWIRLMYLYPAMVDTRLVDYLAGDNKTLNYFDLPLQHCNNAVLTAMRRQDDRYRIEQLLALIRSRSPDAVLRTTFLVGFPGETDQQFADLIDFVATQKFHRLGVFTYSAESGTGAESLPQQLPEKVKIERMDELMRLQHDIALARNNSLIGTIQEVIIDSIGDNGASIGRTRADCPEIDQEVIVRGEELDIGRICRVRIDDVNEYDLVGLKLEG